MSSLADVCTVANVQAALPANGTILGVDMLPATVTANAVDSSSSADDGSAYCNVTVAYAHTGRADSTTLWYTLPEPAAYKNRLYIPGGGGYSLSQAEPTGGLAYGAVSGSTDVGYDGFHGATLDSVVLDGNGTINWQHVVMFSYQALGETAQVGKALAQAFYGTTDKVYTYFEGCSDGGREAMSQAQRYAHVYDGIVAGAPAFHHAQQQINHIASVVTEQTMGYIAPPCEMEKIATATMAACDALDGRADGVVSRTDLCRLSFDMTTLVGASYHCAAQTSSSRGSGVGKRQAGQSTTTTTTTTPEQNGTVTADAVALAQRLLDGLRNSRGERVYVGWQYASTFADAAPAWDSATAQWVLAAPAIGGVFATRFVQLVDADNLASLANVTYDTLYAWMLAGYVRYYDSLQTGYTDLTALRDAGAKLLHYHGESDNSIPPASSVRYHEAVRAHMYPDAAAAANDTAALNDWYQFYLVPGAAHCSANRYQPDAPYPRDNMATIIAWVERGVRPAALNATVPSGPYAGEVQRLCTWPTRPVWAANSSSSSSTATFACEYDEDSYRSWLWDLDAWKIPVY